MHILNKNNPTRMIPIKMPLPINTKNLLYNLYFKINCCKNTKKMKLKATLLHYFFLKTCIFLSISAAAWHSS